MFKLKQVFILNLIIYEFQPANLAFQSPISYCNAQFVNMNMLPNSQISNTQLNVSSTHQPQQVLGIVNQEPHQSDYQFESQQQLLAPNTMAQLNQQKESEQKSLNGVTFKDYRYISFPMPQITQAPIVNTYDTHSQQQQLPNAQAQYFPQNAQSTQVPNQLDHMLSYIRKNYIPEIHIQRSQADPQMTSLGKNLYGTLIEPVYYSTKINGDLKQQNLRYHLGIHSGYEPYFCNICQKSFMRERELKIHQSRQTHYQRQFEFEKQQQQNNYDIDEEEEVKQPQRVSQQRPPQSTSTLERMNMHPDNNQRNRILNQNSINDKEDSEDNTFGYTKRFFNFDKYSQ
eukprot:403363392